MAGFDALNRLWKTVREPSHDVHPSTDIFPTLDTAKIARDLELEERGAANGSENRPVKSARSLDEIEQQAVSKAEEEKKKSFQVLQDEFHTFSDRLRNLDFDGQFGLIRQANLSSLADFQKEVAIGENELHGLRRHLKEAEDELEGFKQKHRLRRAARITSTGMMYLKAGLLLVLLFGEAILNAFFLAKGNEQGFIGGAVQSLTFAMLNIGSATLLAVFCVRYLVHRNWFLKLLGLMALAFYFCLAFSINLALAHFREVSATLFSEAGREVIKRMLTDPLGLADVNSWALFGFGLMASLVAFLDASYLHDPYPGFAATQKRVNAARKAYVDQTTLLIDQLTDIRDEHNEKVEDIIRDLSQRRAEHRAIIAHRSRIIGLFAEHQNQLERSANSLLTVYREANRRTRKDPEPKYFSAPYKMERLVPSPHADEEWNDRDLAARINEAQSELSEQMRLISNEFTAAVQRYHQLDKLFPGT